VEGRDLLAVLFGLFWGEWGEVGEGNDFARSAAGEHSFAGHKTPEEVIPEVFDSVALDPFFLGVFVSWW
jgi:hypothetical protein